jgi:hypothetical protein
VTTTTPPATRPFPTRPNQLAAFRATAHRSRRRSRPPTVGLTEDAATDAAEACGWILRVVRRDGEDLPATLDLRPNRVNVEVTDGEVTAIVNIG